MPSYSVTANSNLADAWKAFDGKPSTYWLSTSAGKQLEFNFGNLVLVKGVRFTPVAGKLDAFPTKITVVAYVEASEGTPVTLGELTTVAPVVGEGQTLYFNTEKKYRRYAFLAEGSSEVAIAEIEFLVLKTIILPEADPVLQEKTVTPSTTSQTVVPDDGYDGLSKVIVEAAPPSGTDTSDATATAADIKTGKTAYGSSGKLTGTMSTVSVPTPTITVSSVGLITASNSQSEGYTAGGSTNGTKQLTTQSAKTWTPTTSNQTISSGTYLTGTQTIKGDSNLVADNIKSGVSIFGVSGGAMVPGTIDLAIADGTSGIDGHGGVIYRSYLPTSSCAGGTSYTAFGTSLNGGVRNMPIFLMNTGMFLFLYPGEGTTVKNINSITVKVLPSGYRVLVHRPRDTTPHGSLVQGEKYSLPETAYYLVIAADDLAHYTKNISATLLFDYS